VAASRRDSHEVRRTDRVAWARPTRAHQCSRCRGKPRAVAWRWFTRPPAEALAWINSRLPGLYVRVTPTALRQRHTTPAPTPHQKRAATAASRQIARASSSSTRMEERPSLSPVWHAARRRGRRSKTSPRRGNRGRGTGRGRRRAAAGRGRDRAGVSAGRPVGGVAWIGARRMPLCSCNSSSPASPLHHYPCSSPCHLR
jgi:hypothetical protein